MKLMPPPEDHNDLLCSNPLGCTCDCWECLEGRKYEEEFNG